MSTSLGGNGVSFDHLTANKIKHLSTQDAAIELDRLDQDIVRQLQEIDANFVRSYRTLTDRILPSLEKYDQASKGMLESAGFWKTFFETAAGIRLTDEQDSQLDISAAEPEEEVHEQQGNNDYGDEDSYIQEQSMNDNNNNTQQGPWSHDDDSLDNGNDNDYYNTSIEHAQETIRLNKKGKQPSSPTSSSPQQTPNPSKSSRKAPRWSTDVPLSATLERNIKDDHDSLENQEQEKEEEKSDHDSFVSNNNNNNNNDININDNNSILDSPEPLQRPELETMVFGKFDNINSDYNKNKNDIKFDNKDNNESMDLDGTPVPPVTTTFNTRFANLPSSTSKPTTLTKIPRSARPTPSTTASSSTPRRPKLHNDYLPEGVGRKYDGITDLTKTPLSSLVSPQKKKVGGPKGKGKSPAPALFKNKSSSKHNPNISLTSSLATDDTMSPPPLFMHVNRNTLVKTPGKEAAKLVTRDVLMSAALRGEKDDWRRYLSSTGPGATTTTSATTKSSGRLTDDDNTGTDLAPSDLSVLERIKSQQDRTFDSLNDSPALDPPSVIKNWKSRGYENLDSTTSQPNFDTTRIVNDDDGADEQEFYDRDDVQEMVMNDDDEKDNHHHPPKSSSDFGGSDDQHEVSFGKSDGEFMEEEDWGEDDMVNNMNNNSDFVDASLAGEEAPIPMEDDTLFGGRQSIAAAQQRRRTSVRPLPKGRKSVTNAPSNPSNDDQNQQNWLKAHDEMHTLHGGDLLQSQPFHHSPLAGKHKDKHDRSS